MYDRMFKGHGHGWFFILAINDAAKEPGSQAYTSCRPRARSNQATCLASLLTDILLGKPARAHFWGAVTTAIIILRPWVRRNGGSDKTVPFLIKSPGFASPTGGPTPRPTLKGNSLRVNYTHVGGKPSSAQCFPHERRGNKARAKR